MDVKNNNKYLQQTKYVGKFCREISFTNANLMCVSTSSQNNM